MGAVALMAFVALLIGLGLSVLSAGVASIALLSPGRVHRLEESGRRGAAQLARLDSDRAALRSATALTRAAFYGSTALAAAAFGTAAWRSLGGAASGGGAAAAVWVVLGLVVGFSVFDALPRTLGVASPERVALEAAPVASALTRVLAPIAAAISAVWVWGVHLAGGERVASPWATEIDERTAAEPGDEAEREEAEEAFLEAVSDFAEKIAREVMVPRPDVAALPDTATSLDATALVESLGFSRVPVYHENIDDVIGIFYAKDLLIRLGHGCGTIPVTELIRPPYFVPETKPAAELLFEMRRDRVHIAIVSDEYGGTAGIVTLEDLIEEIVGDIADEYDLEQPLVTRREDGSFEIDALLPVDDFNEEFGTALESESDTAGGLVFEFAGHVPVVGESVEIEGLRVTVTDVEGNRIRRLLVEPAAPSSEGD